MPTFSIYKIFVYLLEIIGEAVDLGREDLDDGEPEGDPLIAVLRAVKVRDQSVVQASFQPAAKYTGHYLKGNRRGIKFNFNNTSSEMISTFMTRFSRLQIITVFYLALSVSQRKRRSTAESTARVRTERDS